MRIRRLASAVCPLALVAAVGLMPSASATTSRGANDTAQSAEYQRAFELGLQAYVYGYPLLDTDRVFLTSTSVGVPDGAGAGPINQFSNFRRLTNPSEKTVVAPNHDTLYSMAWLDLRRQPIVVHMPVVRRRFVVFELVDPYTTNFANIGSVGRPAGNYALTPPGWHGRLPKGVTRIRSRTRACGSSGARTSATRRHTERGQDPERVLAHPAEQVGNELPTATAAIPPRPAEAVHHSGHHPRPEPPRAQRAGSSPAPADTAPTMSTARLRTRLDSARRCRRWPCTRSPSPTRTCIR